MMTKSTTPHRSADGSAPMSRRALLSRTAVLAAATVLGWPGTGRAQQKMSKQAAQYQDSPNGDQKCADCRFFIEGGSCQLVEGEISPNGWCMLFQPKA